MRPGNQTGAATKVETEVRTLEAGKPIERELKGGETHSYQLTLEAGQYARVVVEQRRINLAVSVFDPAGKKIIDADMSWTGELEVASLVAETPSIYRLEVRSPDKTNQPGSYEIRVKQLRAATEQDRSAVAAERLLAEGVRLDRQATADSWRKSIDKYQESIPLWQAAKDPAGEASAVYLIANVFINLSEKQKAFEFANRALPIAQAAASRTEPEARREGIKIEANALDVLGRAENELGDRKKAMELFSQALALRRTIADRVGEANTLNNMTMAYQAMGDYGKALDLSQQTRLILAELGDRNREATVLNNVCVLQEDIGDYKKALEYCDQALSLRRELKDSWGEATTLNNLSNIYSNLGDYQRSLDLYTRALAIYEQMGVAQGRGITLSNIGFLYDTLGEYQKAIDAYGQALAIFRASGDKYREANVLNNLAVSYADQQDFTKALELNLQVLPLRRATNNRGGEAITLNNIGGCYRNLGEKQKALEYFNQAIALHRTIGNPRPLASALRNIGDLYRELGEYQTALDSFNEALKITRAIGDRNNEAGILALRARLERDRGNLADAKTQIEEALAGVESLRVSVKSQQLRASFLASVRKYYEFDIDVLLRLHEQHPSEGFDAAALEASEKSRARSLLELLGEARAEIRQGVDSSLLERERQLRQAIADKADRQVRLLSAKHTDEEAQSAAKEIDALTTDYEQVQARIRQTSPRYSALIQPQPLSLKAVQTNVLDDETLLLEYALGEEKSFLWAVTRNSINSFELPKREDVESAVRRLYSLLTERNRPVKNESPEQRRVRLDRSNAEFPSAAAALSNMLLRPAASVLGKKRLLIVGEGLLQYVPFAALPDPTSEGVLNIDKGNAQSSPHASHPLVLDHEIVNLPSASVLAVLRRENEGRQTAPKTLAVFADPVFQNDDPRVAVVAKNRPTGTQRESSPDEAYRSASESGLEGFIRLRFSRQEADEITRLAPQEKRFEALDFAASRETASNPDLGQYRIVHFATHGLINNQHPELSGIVLSLIDEKGQPQNGFLRLYEIFNLKLGADLVVLSACQTALGKEIKGEGLVGLTRGFMYAGAPRVVASLWQIDDRASAELMKRFYNGVLGQGLRPAAALRAAQVSMQNDSRWREPHYWAAFTLQGEWK
ncbi:MAG TPA: CHAT domain-containing protein [Blastocatellia bacterium]|nr:CHAT domain-containing protein [Blastocatellia bacterium]